MRREPRARRPTMESPRVALQLLPTLAQGGAELYVHRLTRLQLDGPFRPVVCSMLRGGPTEALLRRDGVPTEVLGIERSSIRRPLAALLDWRRIFRGVLATARRHRADLIQTHLSDADWIGLMASRRLGIPVILTFHSSKLIPPERDPRELRARLRRGLQARYYPRADAMIAVGSEVRDSLLALPGVDPARVHLVPSAIELPEPTTPERRARARARHADLVGDAERILIAVGRAVASKGHDRLLRALPRILRGHPRTRLWIVGAGPESTALERQSAALELGGKALLLGSRQDVPELLAAADVFVTGTRREGLGLAVAEGLAAGLPAVAFRVSGVVDVVEHEQNGLLVPDDDLAAFAAAVERLLDDSDLRARLAAAGRRSAERFDIVHARARTEEIYRTVLAARAGG